MKNVFLSVVIICALAISALGGTFATWSDSETSMDNTIKTGSVDLQVNYADDAPWGDGVGPGVKIECMVPCKLYGPFNYELWNGGQCDYPSEAYIHFKQVCCSNLPPKADTGYKEPVGDEEPGAGTGQLKCEPELVAEYGGKVNCTTVPGVGVQGDKCTMKDHIYVWIFEKDLDTHENIGPPIWDGKLNLLVCEEIYLFDLNPCEPKGINLYFHLQQEAEEEFTIPEGWPGAGGPMNYITGEEEWKFNDWPSWALMKDMVSFNIEFDLVLVLPDDVPTPEDLD